MNCLIPRFMLTAPNSGSGKTTITCGILKALINKGLQPAAFKCGPDYIDPMFHSRVVGAKSRNLDVFMLGADTCRYLLAKNTQNSNVAVLEGVMGYYDGLGTSTEASAYDLAKETGTPVVLIVNGKGAALSMAALIKGFKDFRNDSNIRGVILNDVSQMTYIYYKNILEKETGVKLFGYMPRMENCGFESRHLGLVTAEEIQNLQEIVDRLGSQAEETIDLDSLLEIAETAPAMEYIKPEIEKVGKVKIAIAQDKAFCFYYQDALDLLCEIGAELVPFSPLTDKEMPRCDGFILGGGYPELYAEELSNNVTMLASIKTALLAKKPCIAECGGFMYLLEHYTDAAEKQWPWVGFIQGDVCLTKKLNRFGYIELEAAKDSLLAKSGEKIKAHEFHYSESTANGSGFTASKTFGKGEWQCINADKHLHAGYPHIHLWGNPEFAHNFVLACKEFAEGK